MPRSLSTRLLLAFAFIVLLTLSISAVGTLFLLRDQQREAAEERVGRLAEPIAVTIALLERANVGRTQIQDTLDGYADSFDVRILTVDGEGNVLYDSDARLIGGVVDAFVAERPVIQRGGARFRMASFDTGDESLMLFTSARDSIELTTSQLTEFQAFLYQNAAQGDSLSVQLQNILNNLADGEPTTLSVPLASSRSLVAVPEAEITSAWRDIIPQMSIAGGIALLAATIAAILIARSVTGRLERVTHAAQEMAKGDYEQQLEPEGEDEIGRLANAFNDMSRQVSRSHQMMRDLLANVSHELRTPLTSIQGFSQALEEGAISSPEEYREAGRIINEETDRMRRLVDDLIELSQLESGQATLQREAVDLEDLLATCALRVERRLADSKTDIKLDVTNLPRIEGDGRRLEQVFTNLIDNAVRHAQDGCEITVHAEAQDGHVRVGVHNTGSYIPEEELSRVFERFFQLDRNRSASGSGLGLAIVSEVVQAHGGRIYAKSNRDEGTEFVVELPLKPPVNGRNP
ncbi:MAG: HAMP domain-containing histidine kinase [Chloroflexi bacterium]|nr:HAMP domain-containing histidine kinase [Chloroflexota bacterium]